MQKGKNQNKTGRMEGWTGGSLGDVQLLRDVTILFSMSLQKMLGFM